MIRRLKRLAFAALVIACIAATVVLFLPEKEAAAPATSGTDAVDALPVPMPQTDTGETPHEPDHKGALAEWNTYHGGNTLRGFAETTLPDAPVVLWTVLAGGPVRQTPVAHRGIVFAATARGVVIAVTLEGRELWRRDLAAPEPGSDARGDIRIEAPITAVAGKVFVGADLGDVFALRADTGEVAWRVNIGGPARGAINYSDDGARVFVLDQDVGELVCLNADTGAVAWRSAGVDRSDASPAVAGDIAVFGSCAAALHIVSTDSGERMRDIAIENGGGQIAGGAALADGFACAGVRDGRILCADVAAGKLAWITTVSEDEAFSTPAVHDAWVIMTTSDGRIHALNRETGEIRWQQDLEGAPASPIIAGDKIVAAADGVLFFLRLEDGKRLWQKQVADEISGPAVARDMLIVGGEDGTITALGADG